MLKVNLGNRTYVANIPSIEYSPHPISGDRAQTNDQIQEHMTIMVAEKKVK